jgi:hypothetical protein
MIFWIWLFCLTTLSALVEVILGTRGLAMPCLLVTAFYFAVIRPWQRVLFPLLAAGVAVDLLFGRSFPCHLVMLGIVFAGAQYWRRHGDLRSLAVQAFPGLFVGLVAGMGLLLYMAFRQGVAVLQDGRWCVTWLAGQALWGVALLPVLCWCGDGAARLLAVRRYGRVSPYQIQLEAYGGGGAGEEESVDE